MNKDTPSFLRLHVDEALPSAAPEMPDVSRLELAFEMCTGWCFELSSAAPGDPQPTAAKSAERLGPWRLSPPRPGRRGADPAAAKALAESICALWNELERTRRALWEREAELAAGVPVVAAPDGEAHLAEKLAAAIQGGGEAIGCDAAALYLLDDATSSLKLRSHWGLPASRLVDAPRPLEGQVADLEALLGQAVVLEDAATLPSWKIPEPYPAGLCVPVSTSTTVLGTLWGFCDTPRTFNDRQANVWEITAGRIAAELERQMLLAEAQRSNQRRRVSDRVSVARPVVEPSTPLIDGWEIAGWACGEPAFHDAVLDTEDRLLFAAGSTDLSGIEALLAIQAVRATLRGLATRKMSFPDLLRSLNQALTATSLSDPQWRLALGRLNPRTGRVHLALTGAAAATAFRQQTWQPTGRAGAPMGADPDWSPGVTQLGLRTTELLIAHDGSCGDAGVLAGLPVVDSRKQTSAAEWAESLRQQAQNGPAPASAGVVLRRR